MPADLCERGYILNKLLTFHVEHQTSMQETMRDLHYAVTHIPKSEYGAFQMVAGGQVFRHP